jgi:hypothetical protein
VLLDTAELCERASRCRVRTFPCLLVLGRGHLEMEPHLFVHACVGITTPQRIAEPGA